MHASTDKRGQAGFTLIEMLISLGIMVILSASVLTLLRDGLKISNLTFQSSDAQQSLRTAQEYISHDLTNAGDGMKGIVNICVRTNFILNYLSRLPITGNPCAAGSATLAIINSDNNVPASIAVPQTSPAVTVLSSPNLTDRLTILQADRNFNEMGLAAAAFTSDGLTLNLPVGTNMANFTTGEIYFVSSEVGATFATITAKDAANRRLTFASGDTYGLNVAANGGPIDLVTSNSTLPTSLMRMQIIHYFINSNGLLIRRIFGVKGAGFTDSVIAEHATDMQLRYVLNVQDVNGFVTQPVSLLTNSDQMISVRQVEVTLTTETVRPVLNSLTKKLTMTSSTGVRNMQFLRALQPTAENYDN